MAREKKGKKAPGESKGGRAPSGKILPMGLAAALIANVLIIGTLAYAQGILEYDSDFYYQSVQEDEYIEWATFWAFMAATAVCILGALRQRRATGQLPWFFLGVGLFCFVVGMEEISWAQRVFGYRPPEYFLAENFQQELNLHNVMGKSLRKLLVKIVIGGYGIVLPGLALIPPLRSLLLRLGVIIPPPALMPSFIATYVTYESYPWSFSGEWVELMLGFGFLFTAIVRSREFSAQKPPLSRFGHAGPVVLSWVIIMVMGIAQTALSRVLIGQNPQLVAVTGTELEALKRDFQSDRVRTKCGLHKRVYTFMEKYEQVSLLDGAFARLTAGGLPEARAKFFLDPWNYPYWIRHKCDRKKGTRRTFLYSFGPNRLRDSAEWEVRGDDIGIIFQDRGYRRGR